MIMRVCWLLVAALSVWAQPATPTYPNQIEGGWVARDLVFHPGERLPELWMHYATVGEPARDGTGHVSSAVLILHGTGGTGRAFLAVQNRLRLRAGLCNARRHRP
jgi:homoserine O-acetyltransferase/O-succinyltransferase